MQTNLGHDDGAGDGTPSRANETSLFDWTWYYFHHFYSNCPWNAPHQMKFANSFFFNFCYFFLPALDFNHKKKSIYNVRVRYITSQLPAQYAAKLDNLPEWWIWILCSFLRKNIQKSSKFCNKSVKTWLETLKSSWTFGFFYC